MTQPIHDVMKEIMAQAEAERHLGVAELADYQDGLLTPENTEFALAHLTVCQKCTQSLLELHKLSKGDLEAESLKGTRIKDSRHGKPWQFFLRRDLAWASAASFLLLSVILGYRPMSPSVESRSLDGDLVETHLDFFELFPVGATTMSSTPESEPLQLAEDTQKLVLALHPETELTHKSYEISIEYPGRTIRFPKTPTQGSFFLIELNLSAIKGNRTKLFLYGIDNDKHTELAEFELKISR